MKKKYLLVFVLLLIMISCSKHKQKLLSKSWVFSEIPNKNLNNYQGYTEDRTIFDGSETITFKSNNTFWVNDIEYGTWFYDHNASSITINQTLYQEYTCCGFGQSTMTWEIITLKKDKLVVNHPYYKYFDNPYKLK